MEEPRLKRNRFVIAASTVIAVLLAVAACGNGGSRETTEAHPNAISVFTREVGSGTRDAFFELIGIADSVADSNLSIRPMSAAAAPVDDDDSDIPLPIDYVARDELAELLEANTGEVDRVLGHAIVAGGTGAITNAVAGNPLAIGYISLGAMRSDVRALPVDGIAPSVESVIDGSYPLFRSFNIAIPQGVSALALDFTDFILSAEGQGIISGRGYVAPIQNPPIYSGRGLSGVIQIEGSTSAAPVMRALADAYMALHGSINVSIEVRATGSGAGITAAREGSVDLGMSSRSILDAENEELSDSIIIAHDGIAVIVHPTNGLQSVSIDEIRSIFMGEIARWEDMG